MPLELSPAWSDKLDELWGLLPTKSEAQDALDKGKVMLSRSADELLQLMAQGTNKLSDYFHEISEGSAVGQKAKDRMHRVRAEWQWGSHGVGTGLRVPMPCEIDERFILAAASLAKVTVDQACGELGPDTLLLHRPVTLVLVLAEAAAFFAPGGLPLKELCLSPFCVWEKGQWTRLFSPAILHMDATHLMCNLATALPECLELEASSGSTRFGMELVGLTGLTHAIYVAWAAGSKAAFRRSVEYYSVGAAGLSSVAFALQVVAGEQRKANVAIMGILVPSQYVWVFGLTLAHLCSPGTSFPGHLSGVLAGLVYVYGIKPAASLVKQVFLDLTPFAVPQRPTASAAARGPRFWGGGTTGGRDFTRGEHRAYTHEGRHARWWRQWALSLGSQLGLVALSTGVYLLSSGRSPGRRPINSWQLR